MRRIYFDGSFDAMLLWILTIVFLTGYAALIGYYYYHWKKLTPYEPLLIIDHVFISIVIAARNEEKNLPVLLQSLQQQTYPQSYFEIIIVDDFSMDGTAEVIKKFPLPDLYIIQPPTANNTSSKKKAIEAGIHKAKGELIVITDADCVVDKEWLHTIASFYAEKGSQFIAAPVQFYHNHSLLQLFQAMDFLVLQGITAAGVSAHFHSMCNGANLAYTKSAFEQVNGFDNIDTIASGDDMLLMYKIEKQYPKKVHYLKSKKAIVHTQPMLTWKDFVMQRRRWGSKTLYYDDYKVMLVLAFVYLLNVLFFVLLVAALFHPYYWRMVLTYFLSKTIIEIPFVYRVAKFYGEQKLLKFFPLFQPLHILYIVSVGLWSQLGKYEWKGRTTK